jgi:peptide/nickel transport system ATP-binding protein
MLQTIQEFSATVKNISDDQKSNSVLEVQNLCVEYSSAGFMNQRKTRFKAVDNVSFEVNQHETVGLVGESGCGKTTLGKAILQLIKPSEGKILFNGKDLTSIKNHEQQQLRKELQVVFQDPYGSLNPRLTIGMQSWNR